MRSIKKFSQTDIGFLSFTFFSWRVFLSVLVYFSGLLRLQENFLGGGKENYLANPQFWGWLNFDGEHYLAIAREGYREYTHFYFPAFPFIAKYLSYPFNHSMSSIALTGLLVNHFLAFFAFFGILKLVKLEYGKKVSRATILLMLLFPASFYLVSFYTEALFLFLVVWSFYFARKGRWFLAALLASLCTATRVVGIIMLPALAAEMWIQYGKKGVNIKNFLALSLVPLGLLSYMLFLKRETGDPLIFLNTVNIFGAQRSSSFIPLPQVYYRYIFKILPSLNSYWPTTFSVLQEFVIATIFTLVTLASVFKLRLGYWIFLGGVFLIPTLSGSFSSMPRYTIVIFPAFIFLSLFLEHRVKIKASIYLLLITSLAISTMLFLRGYWIA